MLLCWQAVCIACVCSMGLLHLNYKKVATAAASPCIPLSKSDLHLHCTRHHFDLLDSITLNEQQPVQTNLLLELSTKPHHRLLKDAT